MDLAKAPVERVLTVSCDGAVDLCLVGVGRLQSLGHALEAVISLEVAVVFLAPPFRVDDRVE